MQIQHCTFLGGDFDGVVNPNIVYVSCGFPLQTQTQQPCHDVCVGTDWSILPSYTTSFCNDVFVYYQMTFLCLSVMLFGGVLCKLFHLPLVVYRVNQFCNLSPRHSERLKHENPRIDSKKNHDGKHLTRVQTTMTSGRNHLHWWSRYLILFILVVPNLCAEPASGKLADLSDGPIGMFGISYPDEYHIGLFHPTQRIGEASHPGPFEITVCNVTGLNEKSLDMCRWCGNLCGIAETAATETVIRRESQQVRPLKKHLFHGKPVLPNQITKNGADSLKGQSKGVAIMTGLPFRISPQWSKLTSWQSCRLIAGFVRVAGFDTLVVTVYGYQKNHQDAIALNGELHSQVFSILDSWKGPSIVMGDFNFDIGRSNIFEYGYQEYGLFDVRALEMRSNGIDIGPTTSQTSVTDSILVSGWFASRFVKAWVQQDSGLATHSPVHAIFDLDIPDTNDLTWKLPIPFKILPTPEQFEVALNQCCDTFHDSFEEAINAGDSNKIFLTWSNFTEKCIVSANQVGKSSTSGVSQGISKRQLGRGGYLS